jgi:hypothetical protein
MKTLLSTTAALLTLAALTASASPAQAQSLEHIDRYAVAAQKQAASLCWEIRREFRHDSHFTHLYRDAYDLYRTASHMHEVAHHNSGTPSNMRHLRRDLATLDRKMHHIEGVVDDMRRDLSRRRVRVHSRNQPHVDLNIGNGFTIHLGGNNGHHGRHGSHHSSIDRHAAEDLAILRGLERKLDSLERIIHHLHDDLR